MNQTTRDPRACNCYAPAVRRAEPKERIEGQIEGQIENLTLGALARNLVFHLVSVPLVALLLAVRLLLQPLRWLVTKIKAHE